MAESKRRHTLEGRPPSHRTLTTPHHGQLLMQSLQSMYEKEELCDYSIIAEGLRFKTHRSVLASVSDYFRAMLMGQMIEARQDYVELKGVSARAVKVLLDFAYTGRLRLSMEDVVEVLSGASHLQMPGALQLCAEFLTTEIFRQTCVDILNLAETYAMAGVVKSGIGYIIGNFEKVVETDQFEKLSPKHLQEIVKSNKLRVRSELELFHMVRRWVEFRDERVKDAYCILDHIRFVLIDPEALVDQVGATPMISTNERGQKLIDEALLYLVNLDRQPLLQSPRTQIRNKPCMVAFGGRYGKATDIGAEYNCNKMFALSGNKWWPVSESIVPFLYSAVCVVENFLYVFGGMGAPAHAKHNCYRYDPRFNRWIELAHMRHRRQSFPLVSLGNNLYAFGGGVPICDYTKLHLPTEASEVYSIEKNCWSDISPLPEKRKSAGACLVNDAIYVSGGRTNRDTTSASVWCYKPATDTWTEKRPMLTPHDGHAMLAHDSKIYVIDRRDLSVETYSPESDQWTRVIGQRESHAGVARPAVMGHWVYFFTSPYSETGKGKRFNVLTKQFEDLPVYPEKVHCVIGACLTLPQSVFSDNSNNNSGHGFGT